MYMYNYLQCRRPGFNPWVRKIPWKENSNKLQYSCLENPMERDSWRATVHGVTRVGHDLVTKPPPPVLSKCILDHYLIRHCTNRQNSSLLQIPLRAKWSLHASSQDHPTWPSSVSLTSLTSCSPSLTLFQAHWPSPCHSHLHQAHSWIFLFIQFEDFRGKTWVENSWFNLAC